MLQVNQLRKLYGSLTAVADFNLRVEKGVCYGLLGPNGAGKTTAISMIVGTLEPDGGEILLDGQRILPDQYSVKRRIGYVPQDLALYEELSAQENLRFFGTLYDLRGLELQSRIDWALAIAALSDRRSGPVREFSGGMKRRLNIAAALLHKPDFVVLDEPTVGVDPQSRNQIFETLENLLADGSTLLYTTHYMEEVERLCSHAAIMNRGRVIADGPLAELHHLVPRKQTVEIEIESHSSILMDSLGIHVQRADGRIVLQLEDFGTDLSGLLSQIALSGAQIKSLRTTSPSLEEVFLHLTGRQLRD